MNYETKCRRCGKIHEWHFSEDPDKTAFENWQRLHHFISEVMNYPTTNTCDCSDKLTIHDYVSLDSKPAE